MHPYVAHFCNESFTLILVASAPISWLIQSITVFKRSLASGSWNQSYCQARQNMALFGIFVILALWYLLWNGLHVRFLLPIFQMILFRMEHFKSLQNIAIPNTEIWRKEKIIISRSYILFFCYSHSCAFEDSSFRSVFSAFGSIWKVFLMLGDLLLGFLDCEGSATGNSSVEGFLRLALRLNGEAAIFPEFVFEKAEEASA